MTATLLVTIFASLLGLAVGSFLNVVVWRVPHGGKLSTPPSACPKCDHAIRSYDNVPVISWLFLRGKCRDCGEPISLRYPVVEAATAISFGIIAAVIGAETSMVWALPAFLYFAAISIALTLIDLDTQTLPNKIVLPSILVGLALLAMASAGTGNWYALLGAVLGSLALFIFYFIVAVVSPRGMGMGDVKLSAVIGLYLGWLGWGTVAVGAFAAFLLGGLFAIALLVFKKAGRRSAIPFGPWMIAGAWIGIAFGAQMWNGYLVAVGLS
ncbi:prepilin peptidase [Salinibacterium sp. UTAS2018]|uniref:prepilin peptidase n=1 Tax=Salinibacterium sp. UTAS2018 TaxID=2508880 RepID=UPI00100971E7|nr:A24 family peptidase [Salinibacterium sp. UTAS2018]QAV70259.1 prepilin peptidase [Salinibacterium sp. UTAS2018]